MHFRNRSIEHCWHLLKTHMQPPELGKVWGTVPIMRDDKLVVPLQTADMLAWYARRYQDFAHRGGPDHEAMKEAISSFPAKSRLFALTGPYIQARFNAYIEATNGGYPYEDGKARSRRLSGPPMDPIFAFFRIGLMSSDLKNPRHIELARIPVFQRPSGT
jgi:hypothetical protein